MTQHKKLSAVIFAAVALSAVRADAVIRIAPVKIAPISLPNVGMPLMPMPIEMPNWPVLPIVDYYPMVPNVNLPGVDVPVVSPNPVIEEPTWPVLPSHFQTSGEAQAAPRHMRALKAVAAAEKYFGLKDIEGLNAPRLNAAFDGLNNSKPEDDRKIVELPQPSRPAIDEPSRPLTLPEDDLLRDLGF